MLQHSTNGAHAIFGENTFGTPELQVRELSSSNEAGGMKKNLSLNDPNF
jgi:hypothetical protein